MDSPKPLLEYARPGSRARGPIRYVPNPPPAWLDTCVWIAVITTGADLLAAAVVMYFDHGSPNPTSGLLLVLGFVLATFTAGLAGYRRMLQVAWAEFPWGGSGFLVGFNAAEITVQRPNVDPHRIRWDDLQMVAVETTSAGPLLEDVFLVLIGTTDRLVIPNRAVRSAELAERLLQLPGFDREAYARAIRCTSDRSFVVWKRPRPNEAG